MSFFLHLTEAMASRQSLLVTGLDPNPEMLRSWNRHRGGATGSFLSQARRWIKAVIEATVDHVCAYKPSLGFYQALGPVGLELLLEVRDLVPRDLPLIVDAKHGDLNSSTALAHYLFRELGADGVTLSPLAGQDIAAPFLLYPEKGVVVTCHSSNPAARVVQHHPDEEQPLYLRIVREAQCWATPEQLLLEVGTNDPAVLERVRREAPERFLILRSLWGEEERLGSLMEAGLSSAADGLLLPLPQNLLVEDDIAGRTALLKRTINDLRLRSLEQRRWQNSGSRGDGNTDGDTCSLWLPGQEEAAVGNGAAAADPLDSLIVDLFDIGCLLFGEYVQASGAVFNYYI
ncbi:MAG: bifunctional orotidine-5'-phosphate decarboxylase/orotate phosphoribosyltransferase, partial [Cyanobacteriota bacterium]|nr:bifunctional orotidine-5'-phosphate decarboxylase/orotate phosphoribosyltransferase [Cyanobacteriota bacterium]